MQYYKDLTQCNLQPNSDTVDIVLKYHQKRSEYDALVKFFNELPVAPTVNNYNVMMDILSAKGKCKYNY
jgi:hypothetical protein